MNNKKIYPNPYNLSKPQILRELWSNNKNFVENILNQYINTDYDCITQTNGRCSCTGIVSMIPNKKTLSINTEFFEKNNYKVDIIDFQNGDEAGIKSVTLKISGEYVYGNLKSENGVHRLVRISPFDSNQRRHTSFASVEVTPEFDEEVKIEVKDEDLKKMFDSLSDINPVQKFEIVNYISQNKEVIKEFLS